LNAAGFVLKKGERGRVLFRRLGREQLEKEETVHALSLDLEHVKGKQDDLADTNERAARRAQHGFSVLLPKCRPELLLIVCCQKVVHVRLPAEPNHNTKRRLIIISGNNFFSIDFVLVDSLQDLVSAGIAETRKEGKKLAAHRSCRMIAKDDLLELRDGELQFPNGER
jgi:hypothetical protein